MGVFYHIDAEQKSFAGGLGTKPSGVMFMRGWKNNN